MSGKLNLLSRWPGDGLGGVVALEGLDEVRKGAGDDGVEDVVEDGLLLESRFMAGGCSFFVRALGRVPKWGSAARSTGLLISEGTDSVLRSLASGRKDILQAGASFVHLLWHFNLQCLHFTPNIMLFWHTLQTCDNHDFVENLCVTESPISLRTSCGDP